MCLTEIVNRVSAKSTLYAQLQCDAYALYTLHASFWCQMLIDNALLLNRGYPCHCLRGLACVSLERGSDALKDSLLLDQELVNGPHECFFFNGFF
jgi:hypothetical protein